MPRSTASLALLRATADATASVDASTTTTTVALPRKMRHARERPRVGGSAAGTAAGVPDVGAPGVYDDVVLVDDAGILVIFAELVLVLDVLVAARVELVLLPAKSRGGDRDLLRAFARAIMPHVQRVLARG